MTKERDPRNEETKPHLTERDREVLRLTVAGLMDKEIAMDLHIESKIVKTHREHLREKFSVENRTQMCEFVIYCKKHLHNLRQKQNNGAFSLLELLVVLFIIAVLSSLLFPLLSASRARVRQTSCLNNLSQIGKAGLAYIQDWSETLPYGSFQDCYYTHGMLGIECKGDTWKDLLFPYLKNNDVFMCPINAVAWGKNTTYSVKGDSSGRFPVSYGINYFICRGFKGIVLTNAVLKSIPIPLSRITEPSATIFVGDTTEWNPLIRPYFIYDPQTMKPFSYHNKQIDYVFLDGHVKGLKATQIFYPKSLWGPNDLVGEGWDPNDKNQPIRPINPLSPDSPLLMGIPSYLK